MPEQKANSNIEEEDWFKEYIDEMNSIVSFDDEECPVCGMPINNLMSSCPDYFVLLAETDEIETMASISGIFELNKVRFCKSFENGGKPQQIIRILVHHDDYEKAQKLLLKIKSN